MVLSIVVWVAGAVVFTVIIGLPVVAASVRLFDSVVSADGC